MSHPLDRPVWNALALGQADLAVIDGPARRLRPKIGIFAAAADGSRESVAALRRLRRLGAMALVETDERFLPDALIASRAACDQMVLEAAPTGADIAPGHDLGENDAAEMLALASITRPGPFLARTHRLGGFVGIRIDGRLVAMAGERLRPPGFAEVSGVCTHPDFRGRGLAAGLIRRIGARIIARGETPFLQSYSSNVRANALYVALGFRPRCVVTLAMLA